MDSKRTLLEPIWLGSHLALDFLNTLASPKGTPIDWIDGGRSLLQWMVGAGILEPEIARKITATCGKSALDATAKEARKLREWFRGLTRAAKRDGRFAITDDVVKRLNRVLAREAGFQRIEASGRGSLQLVAATHWSDGGQLLVPIARAMAELVCEADTGLVKECEDASCTVWFYDRTKGHHRRWCSSAICGNRAKVAAFRERERSSR